MIDTIGRKRSNSAYPSPSVTPQTWRWFAIAIILLGSALRLYQLGQDSLWLDEIITQQMTQLSIADMLKLVGTYDDHPPLYYLLAYQNKLLGFSDFAARLTAAAAGVLTIPVLIILARKLWGYPAGLIAGLLLALWPTHLHFSQEARQYTLLMLLTSISMYWLYRGVIGKSAGAWIGYIISTTGALYSHNFAFLWIAAQVVFVGAIWLLSFIRSGVTGLKTDARYVILPFALSLISIGILYLPWASSLLTQSNRLIDGVSLPATAGAGGPSYTTIIQQSLIFFSGENTVFETIIIILASTGLVVAALRRRWPALLLVLVSLITPILMMGLISSSHFFTARYFLPFLTPIILLCTEAIHLSLLATYRIFKQSKNAELVTMVVLFIILMASAIVPIQRYYQQEKEDWHGVARMLNTNMASDDLILVDGMMLGKAGDAGRVQQSLNYYLPDENVLEITPGAMQAIADHPDASAAAWGVLWYQNRVAERDQIPDHIALFDFYDLVVVQVEQPTGELLRDSASVLEAILQLQHLAESHPDLHLTLAKIYLELGDDEMAAAHAASLMPFTGTMHRDQNDVFFDILASPSIQASLSMFDFIGDLDRAEYDAPAADFAHLEQGVYTIDSSTRNALMLHAPASLTYTLHIPHNATFLTMSLATDPDTWNWGGDGVTFQLDIVSPEDSERVLSHPVGNAKEDRRWHDVVIDMRPYRDRDVTMQFSVDPGPAEDYTGDRSLWAHPLLWRASPGG